MEKKKEKQRVGVYICHCGGNISDYVDVGQIRELVSSDEHVAIAKDVMFACADSNQKEMEKDIREKKLDAIVVASCSPKLHLHTFRNVAERSGLNPYNYVQVNIREQCSWPHSDHPTEATIKATGLIRAGIHRVLYSEALENIRVEAKRTVVVIGAGVAGLRSSIDLARMGNQVFLIEKEPKPGGQIASRKALFPVDMSGSQVVDSLIEQVKKMPAITLFTNATVDDVSGSIGDFTVRVTIHRDQKEKLSLQAGAILVTTGYDNYQPSDGEFGYAQDAPVVTLPDFNAMLEGGTGQLTYHSKPVRSIAFIYCVGMRQTKGENKYCSRVCCSSAIHTSIQVHKKYEGIRAFHLYRDIRTYGKLEIMYEQSSKAGDTYLMYAEKEPPIVERQGDRMRIKVKDLLTKKKELELDVDLVVLVTGMVPRSDSLEMAQKLKIPIGADKFFNEIHPKLRPVETVINGVYLGGSCQGPKNITESVNSSLSAAAKINAIIRKGIIDLEPIVARVDEETCTWCGKCTEVCEYDALFQMERNGKVVAGVNESVCTGCGICAPVCPVDAIEIARYSNEEIESMIDGFAEAVTIKEKEAAEGGEEETGATVMKEYPQIWNDILATVGSGSRTIPEIAKSLNIQSEMVTWHVMTMHKYQIMEPAGIDDNDEFYLYKRKN
jgi:heterodisulfide reductase subunit A